MNEESKPEPQSSQDFEFTESSIGSSWSWADRFFCFALIAGAIFITNTCTSLITHKRVDAYWRAHPITQTSEQKSVAPLFPNQWCVQGKIGKSDYLSDLIVGCDDYLVGALNRFVVYSVGVENSRNASTQSGAKDDVTATVKRHATAGAEKVKP